MSDVYSMFGMTKHKTANRAVLKQSEDKEIKCLTSCCPWCLTLKYEASLTPQEGGRLTLHLIRKKVMKISLAFCFLLRRGAL